MRTFFRRVHKVLRPGGTFVLEPQEWDTYGKAKRMDPVGGVSRLYVYWAAYLWIQRLKENAKDLMLRPEEFGRVLQDMGFGPGQHLGSAGEGGKLNETSLFLSIDSIYLQGSDAQ